MESEISNALWAVVFSVFASAGALGIGLGALVCFLHSETGRRLDRLEAFVHEIRTPQNGMETQSGGRAAQVRALETRTEVLEKCLVGLESRLVERLTNLEGILSEAEGLYRCLSTVRPGSSELGDNRPEKAASKEQSVPAQAGPKTRSDYAD